MKLVTMSSASEMQNTQLSKFRIMSQSKDFKHKFAVLRNNLIHTFRSTARCFESHEVECEILKPIQYAPGYDDQDEPQMPHYVKLDGSIEIYHQGNEVATVQPEDCETEFLLEVLEEMEKELEVLRKENA